MRLYVLTLLVILNISVFAQNFPKYSVGASIHGMVTNAMNFSSSNEIVTGNQTYSQYNDSVNSNKSYRTSFGATLWGHMLINKVWSMQAGIGYIDVGYQRNQTNIQYLDPLFPGIGSKGKVLEKSNTNKIVDYNYRYQYLTIPIMFNHDVYASKDFFYKLSLTGGAALNVLVHHDIQAKLYEFVVEGKDVYNLDSTGCEGRRLALSMMLGAKSEYRYDKKTIIYIMPVFGVYPISVTHTHINSFPYYFQLNVGVQYAFNLSEERSR